MTKLISKNYFFIFEKTNLMKKLSQLPIALFLLLSISINAQGKLKGNKEVTTENREISNFTKVEVLDKISVKLVYNENQSVLVETDSNLQSSIITEVVNGTLIIKLNEKIGKYREMAVHLSVNNNLKELFAYNKSSLKSDNLLIIDSLKINAFDDAEITLKVNTKTLDIQAKKTTKLNLEAVSNETIINTEESANLKATIDTKNILIYVLDRSDIYLKGTCSHLEMESNGNSIFKGNNFKTKTAIVKTNNNSKAYIDSSESIDISAFNSSEVYLYANPKITLAHFLDKASLYKRPSN